jgi:hypothetical protein
VGDDSGVCRWDQKDRVVDGEVLFSYLDG